MLRRDSKQTELAVANPQHGKIEGIVEITEVS